MTPVGASDPVVKWLLEPDQPAVRYLALTRWLGRSESDASVRRARGRMPMTGWVADILRDRDPAGWWVHSDSLYTPKYVSTNWRLLALAELGATRQIAAVRESCELWMARSPLQGGGVGGNASGKGHLCCTGNMARALVRFGYADDPRVRGAMEWLAETASPKGGWSCWGIGRNLDSWEGLSAFAAYPRSKWTPAMTEAVAQGAEFFLERELWRQGDRYAPWFRFHWPVHYYYDLLVGLEVLTELGYGADRRLDPALELLRRKRRRDGRWNLDAVHPDVRGPMAAWYRKKPPQPLGFEVAGRPSKMITLRALRVLDRVATARGGT